MRTNGPQATLGELEQKAIVRERAACRLEPARTQPCRRRHQLRARSPWLVLRRGPSEAIFPQPLLDSSHRARRRLITHPGHSARRSGRPSGSFCVELGVDLCLHAPDLVQTWAGVTRQHPCSERRAHRSISRNSRSATIAADVKRFCHQIKSDDVFGTHRSAPDVPARARPPVVRPISSKDTLLVLSNGQEIPGLRNMEQVVQVRTGLWYFTDCLHDIVCYKIRGPWIR